MSEDTNGEMRELFAYDGPVTAAVAGTKQSLQITETKKMIPGNEDSASAGNSNRTITSQATRAKIYTYLIFISGSLLAVSFGTMLGWPSPTYPRLLTEGPILINIDQSAMIAGMLMNGFVVATPFVSCDCLGSKFGVVLGAAFMLSGWLLMVGATNVLGLCISRILVGFGAGFGTGKLKFYLKETCNQEYGIILPKYLPIFVCLGVIISFSVGPFVQFQMLAIINTLIPGIAFLTFIIVPDTPYNLFHRKKLTNAVAVLQNLHGKQCVDNEIANIKLYFENKPTNKTIYQILRNQQTRNSFLLLTFLMTIQQFSGGPSLIVYSQIVFTEMNCFYPYLCAIVYAITFLFSTFVGVQFVSQFKRKPLLLLSLLGCTLTSICHLTYLYLNPANMNYSFIPLISMFIYCFCHTAGVATLTNVIINDIFPPNSRYTITCFWNMYTLELAVIVTKIFQVLYDRYAMYVGFCLYTTVSIFGFMTILIFLPETKGRLEKNRTTV